LSHTCRIDHKDAMKATSTTSSTTNALASNDDSHASVRSVAPRAGASRIRAAAPVEAPEARNNAPSHGLSAQMGRFVTERRIPVYPAMKRPSSPPTPETSLAIAPRTAPPTARRAGIWSRPSSALAPRADSTANNPNRRIAHAPNEMGDQPLNMMAG